MAVVMIVENDLSTANEIASALEREGFTVVRAENDRKGLIRRASEHFDAIVLNRLLPEFDGLGLLTALRAAGVQTPVLILGALSEQTTLRVGDLVIELVKRTVHRARRSIELAAREYDLLVYLARHAGQVVTRATLFEAVWRYRHDERSNVIDVHVGRLRRKVDGQDDRAMIFTVRGAGYVLKAPA